MQQDARFARDMLEDEMYDLSDYARMIADDVRTGGYVRALAACVRPGSIVVDLGTGTGILAMVACRLGARRVYAIDCNEAVEVARELALENGCSDRIVFIREDALRVTLPERGDIVVADLRGGMPSAVGALTRHAREHFLADAGVFIPACDTLRVAVVGNAARYESALGPRAAGDVTLEALRGRLANCVHKDRSRNVRPSDLLTAGTTWATLDYATVDSGPIRGHVEWHSPADGVGHGLLLWFDTDLFDGRGFSTAPGVATNYPQTFLPWTAPVSLRRGDRIAIDLWCQPDGVSWGWNTDVLGVDGERRVRYRQSTFLADLLVPRGASSSAPQLHEAR
jgi:protein arginine N-methyltransferase 1